MSASKRDIRLWEQIVMDTRNLDIARKFYIKLNKPHMIKESFKRIFADICNDFESDSYYGPQEAIDTMNSVFYGRNCEPELSLKELEELIKESIVTSMEKSSITEEDFSLIEDPYPSEYEKYRDHHSNCVIIKLDFGICQGAVKRGSLTGMINKFIKEEVMGPVPSSMKQLEKLNWHYLIIDHFHSEGITDLVETSVAERVLTFRLLYLMAREENEETYHVYEKYGFFDKDLAKSILEYMSRKPFGLPDDDCPESELLYKCLELKLGSMFRKEKDFDYSVKNLLSENGFDITKIKKSRKLSSHKQAKKLLDSAGKKKLGIIAKLEKLKHLANLMQDSPGILKLPGYASEVIDGIFREVVDSGFITMFNMGYLLDEYSFLWDHVSYDSLKLLEKIVSDKDDPSKVISRDYYEPHYSSSINCTSSKFEINFAYRMLEEIRRRHEKLPEEDTIKKLVFLGIAVNALIFNHYTPNIEKAEEIYLNSENKPFINEGQIRKFLQKMMDHYSESVDEKRLYMKVFRKRVFTLANSEFGKFVESHESMKPYARLCKFLNN